MMASLTCTDISSGLIFKTTIKKKAIKLNFNTVNQLHILCLFHLTLNKEGPDLIIQLILSSENGTLWNWLQIQKHLMQKLC